MKHVQSFTQSKIDEVDLTALVSHIRGLKLDFGTRPREWDYESAVLILSDAILSVRRDYVSIVTPIMDRIRRHRLHEYSLEQLVEIIDTRGCDHLMALWEYRDRERVIRLRDLTLKFIGLKSDMGLSDDMETLKHWAQAATVEGSKSFGVRGVGIATYQYLRILSGIDTVKPDVHLKQAVKDATDRQCSDLHVIALIEAASRRMEIPARKLEYAIWKHYSDKAKNSAKCV
jgi:hypothetical protein